MEYLPQGDRYKRNSLCLVCPYCEKERPLTAPFFALLAAPARRALERQGILTLNILSRYTEKEVLALHGIGKTSLPKLRQALEAEGLRFREEGDGEKGA